MIGGSQPMSVVSLTDHRQLIPAVAKILWKEWSIHPGRETLQAWQEIVSREAGGNGLPATLVGVDDDGSIVGTVGLAEYDVSLWPQRSPWVVGMVVRTDRRGSGVGRYLLARIEDLARLCGFHQVWVSTGDDARGFYQACGWQWIETAPAEDPGWPPTNILARGLRPTCGTKAGITRQRPAPTESTEREGCHANGSISGTA